MSLDYGFCFPIWSSCMLTVCPCPVIRLDRSLNRKTLIKSYPKVRTIFVVVS